MKEEVWHSAVAGRWQKVRMLGCSNGSERRAIRVYALLTVLMLRL